MPSTSDAAPFQIFISYRRGESNDIAGRLYDAFVVHFGPDQVFIDVDTIQLGVDFTRVLTEAVSSCDVLIAVIGSQWLTIEDSSGRRRLDNSDDYVRLELKTALERDVRVIPALVQGAQMPAPDQLPDDLAGLARRNGISLSSDNWRAGIERLIATAEDVRRERLSTPPVEAGGRATTDEFRELASRFEGASAAGRRDIARELRRITPAMDIAELKDRADFGNVGERFGAAIGFGEHLRLSARGVLDDADIVSTLRDLLNDPSSFVRYRAAEALRGVPPKLVRQHFESDLRRLAAGDPNADVQRMAQTSLGPVGAAPPAQAAEPAEQLLQLAHRVRARLDGLQYGSHEVKMREKQILGRELDELRDAVVAAGEYPRWGAVLDRIRNEVLLDENLAQLGERIADLDHLLGRVA